MYDMERRARQVVLAQEGDQLEELRAQAATYVRSRAVDEAEAQTFLDMLGIPA
jgi:hypothetical protein